MILKKIALATALVGFLTVPSLAQDNYAIRNARIVTVSGETIERGTILIENGLISEVGDRVSIPRRTKVIDGRGLTVYPGVFDADTRLGLTEVGAEPVTVDTSDLGDYQPQLQAFAAFHVESDLIPVARVDGITHVVTRPTGSTIPGQAAVMDLAGWSPAEMEIKRQGAMVLEFPSLVPMRRRFFGFGGGQRTYADRKKEFDKKVGELKDLLAKTRHYIKAGQQGAAVDFDKQLDALVPVVKGEMPVLIEADSHVDIKEAVKFAQAEGIHFVLLGASDAWRVADFLKENDVRVILGPRQSLPARDDDPIDIIYRTPAILHEKGVKFAIASGGASDVRTLPFEAGNAVSYGLPREEAIRAITLAPAEFLGLADQLGSIEKGKRANLVVTDGDLLEYQTKIRHVFINGAEISLESKHTALYRKYLNRP